LKFSTALIEKFHPVLKASGFRRVAQHWYKSNGEITQVINLQQSRLGNWTYVNCAIHVDRLCQTKSPKHYECPLDFRLEWVVPGELAKLIHGDKHRLLSENAIEPTENDADQFAYALENYALPYLDRFSSEAEIVRLASQAPTELDRNFAANVVKALHH
jgi:hypothetical protein